MAQPTLSPSGPTENADSGGAETPETPTLVAGLDVYSGISNLEGQNRFSDGFWATGAGVAYPSAAYLQGRWRGGAQARLSLGTGALYRGANRVVKQPIEAWYQRPVGPFTATVGKYFVPFALQEWQYETKTGVQLQRELGASDFAASLNHNRDSNRPNLYFRAGRDFGEGINVGVSLAGGDGLSYGSLHNRALGLDASLQRGSFQLTSEFLAMQRRPSDRFLFFYGKLVYEKDARLKPFVALYKWSDRGDAFGDFRSVAAGATYAIKPELQLEGGAANTSDKTVYWLQLHLLLERDLLRRTSPLKTVE